MELSKLISIKLKAFQKKYKLYYYYFPFLFKYAEKYLLKKKRKIQRELEDEGAVQKDLTAVYLLTFGKFGFWFYLFSNAAASYSLIFFRLLYRILCTTLFFFI